jgi:hypothetical protein
MSCPIDRHSRAKGALSSRRPSPLRLAAPHAVAVLWDLAARALWAVTRDAREPSEAGGGSWAGPRAHRPSPLLATGCWLVLVLVLALVAGAP